MSFNDLPKKEAAKKRALQEKETKSTSNSHEGPVSETQPVDPSRD